MFERAILNQLSLGLKTRPSHLILHHSPHWPPFPSSGSVLTLANSISKSVTSSKVRTPSFLFVFDSYASLILLGHHSHPTGHKLQHH